MRRSFGGGAGGKSRPSARKVKEEAQAHPIWGEPKNTFLIKQLLYYPDTVLLTDDESKLQSAIMKMCRELGLLAYHTVVSDGSKRGFPDLVIVGWGGIAFWELKSETGQEEPDQTKWLFALRRIAKLSFGLIQVATYRPSDWGIDGPICQALEKLARHPKGVPSGNTN